MLAFGFAFMWMFVTVGLVAGNVQAAQGMSLLIFPLSFVSSAMVPVDSMPGWLQPVAEHQPITVMTNAVRSLALGDPALAGLSGTTAHYVTVSLLWAAGLVAVFAPLAVARFPQGLASPTVPPDLRATAPVRSGGTVASRLLAMSDFNAQIIEEFRANAGKVGGDFGRADGAAPHDRRPHGRRSRQPLVYGRDGDNLVVFASSGGAPTHPDWFHNLVAHPDVTVEVGTDTVPVRARVAEGDERERLWARQKAHARPRRVRGQDDPADPRDRAGAGARLKKTCGGGVRPGVPVVSAVEGDGQSAPPRVRGLRPRGETSPAPRSRGAGVRMRAKPPRRPWRARGSTGIRWPPWTTPRGTSPGRAEPHPLRRTPRLPAPAQIGVPEVEPGLIPALLALPETQRTAVWLVHARQWRYGEVAEAMGTSVSMVGNHVRRGSDRLRQHLEVDARA